MGIETFGDLEHAGWEAKAGAYDAGFSAVTQSIFPSILNHLGGDLSNRRVLDICCGTGELTSALATMGADVTGLDFSEAMIAIARKKFPMLDFKTDDAQSMHIDAGSIDDVICSFGLLHLPEPDKAIEEAARVLKPGGRYLFTVWNGPDQSSGFMDIILSAIDAHGATDVDVPAAPPVFRFADTQEAKRTLSDVGFDAIEVETVAANWHPPSGQAFLDMIYGSTVRMSLMLKAQSPDALTKIEADIIERAEATRDGSNLVISTPATLVSALKPV